MTSRTCESAASCFAQPSLQCGKHHRAPPGAQPRHAGSPTPEAAWQALSFFWSTLSTGPVMVWHFSGLFRTSGVRVGCAFLLLSLVSGVGGVDWASQTPTPDTFPAWLIICVAYKCLANSRIATPPGNLNLECSGSGGPLRLVVLELEQG